MSNSLKFSIFNSLAALATGVYITVSAIANGYWMFIIAAPAATFLCAYILWQRIIGVAEVICPGKLILIGFLTGSISHYLCWLLLNIGLNICYVTTGGCTSSLAEPPIPVWQMTYLGLIYTGISLLFLGWITIPASIAFAFLTSHLAKK